MTNLFVKTKLADAMSIEFQRDLEKDNLPKDEIEKKLASSRNRITNAPLVIILCVDMTDMDVYPDEKKKKAEYIMATQSAANAGMQLLLAAHAEGLGSVWVCSPLFVPNVVQKALELPVTWEPQAMYFLGYPDIVPPVRERKPLDAVVIRSISYG